MTLASRVLGSLAKLPPATSVSVSVERDLAAKMTDGAVLLADRWYPTGNASGGAPVVLLRTPYGRRQWGMVGRLFSERGYQVVIQSCRGTFGSGGDWNPFRNERVRRSGDVGLGRRPTVVRRQARHFRAQLSGTHAMGDGVGRTRVPESGGPRRHGVEFPGCRRLPIGLLRAGDRAHVAHPARTPGEGTGGRSSPLRSPVEEGFGPPTVFSPWATPTPRRSVDHVPFFQDWIAHESPGDSWWDPIDFGRRPGIVPPASLVGGWYDIFLPSQLDDYRALRAAGRRATLTIGPWAHTSPGVLAASFRDGLALFDGQLLDRPGPTGHQSVRVFVMGARRWVELADWPPPFEEQAWYLGTGGKLAAIPSCRRPRSLPLRSG